MSSQLDQKAFTKVVLGLRAQGCQSVDESGLCSYRAGNLKCAAGMLIEDEEYDQEMEGCAAYEGIVAALFRSKNYNIELMEALQSIHDDDLPERWESGFAKVARDFKLEVPPKQ
jgi:hypothetical protein